MKLIAVTAVGLSGTVEIATACVVNDGEEQGVIPQLQPLADQLAMNVTCVALEHWTESLKYLEAEIEDARREADQMLKGGK